MKVYNDLGKGVLKNAWEGFNTSLFAYGQTGSGKSWSIVGYGANKGNVSLFFMYLVMFVHAVTNLGGRHVGLVVSALDSGSRGPGSSPSWVIVLCSSLHCQGNLTKYWGVTCDRLASHPGVVASFMLQKPG